MRNKYLASLIFSIMLAIVSVVLTILYFVENRPLEFGLAFSWSIFNIFNAGYKWNDYSTLAFLIKTMKENIEDLKHLVHSENEEE